MNIKNVINAIQHDRVNITRHAFQEAKEDELLLDEIYRATRDGEIIEDYPGDTPYPSCLIYGRNQYDEPIHTVWAYAAESQIAILITVYRPDPDRWIDWRIRK